MDAHDDKVDLTLLKWAPDAQDLAGLVRHWRGAAEGARQAHNDTLQLLLVASDQLRMMRRANDILTRERQSTQEQVEAERGRYQRSLDDLSKANRRIDELDDKVRQLLNALDHLRERILSGTTVDAARAMRIAQGDLATSDEIRWMANHLHNCILAARGQL